MAGTTSTSVQSVDRAVALLEVVAATGPHGVSLKEVTDKVGLAASTGRTLLASLITHGLVTQNATTRRYLLGTRLFEFNRLYVARSDLSAVAAPVLRSLWERTAETVHLAVLHGARRVDIAVLVGPQVLNINPTSAPIGDPTVPLYRTAAGKVLFAGLTTRERADMMATAPWRTRHTDALPADVATEMDRVREHGFATNLEEDEPGVCGVAAPVADHSGRTVAALCVGYPAVRHHADRAAELRGVVSAAAAELSSLLGAESKTEGEE